MSLHRDQVPSHALEIKGVWHWKPLKNFWLCLLLGCLVRYWGGSPRIYRDKLLLVPSCSKNPVYCIVIFVSDVSAALPVGDATETSSKARWAADAATTTTSNATTTTAAADATAATTEFANTVAGDISSSVDAAAQVLSELPTQGDFASLGLGGYSPIGLIQSSLEYLHVQANLPWWLAIISCTIALRVLMFPLSVKVQANGARMNNIQPEMEKLMEKMKRYNQVCCVV